MNTIIGADAAKLAGLQIDLLQKIRSGQITLGHLEWFSKLTKEERERFCSGAYVIPSRVIPIDRTTPFDPVKLLGQGWTIDEQDERSLALNHVDLAGVRLERMLKEEETQIGGEERLERLKKAGHIRLDAKVFQTLWEAKKLIPESWKEKINGNIRYILFDGTVFCSPDGRRSVLYLYWDGGCWHWDYHWLGHDRYVAGPSAVLASI